MRQIAGFNFTVTLSPGRMRITHLPGDMTEYYMPIFQPDAHTSHSAGFHHLSPHPDDIVDAIPVTGR